MPFTPKPGANLLEGTTVRFDRKLLAKIRKEARKANITTSEYIRQVMTSVVGK